MPFFHCTIFSLETNSVIQPGNWGKKIFEIGPVHNSWNREMALEAVRVWHYPHKPSRLKGAFACESSEAIQCYKSKHCPEGYIYEVEISDENAAIHKGDFNAVEPLAGFPDDMWTIAHRYWQYNLRTNVKEWPGIECSEILTASPLMVVKKVAY